MTATVRPYTEGDSDEFIELHRSIFDSDFSEELFEWKYTQAPGTDAPRIVVAEHDDSLVGAVGSIHVPLAVEGHSITGRSPVDIMIDEEFRGARLFINLVEELREVDDEDVAVEFGTGVRRTRIAWERFGGWKYSDVDRHVRVQRPEDLVTVNAEAGPVVSALLTLAGGSFRAALRIRDALAEFGTQSWNVSKEPGYSSTVFESIPQSPQPVSIRCDSEFWEWRMSDERISAETYWIGDPDDPLAAVLTAKHNTSDPQCEIALQRSCSDRDGQFALLGIYREIISDHRDTTAIRVTNNGLDSIATAAGLNHGRWAMRVNESRYADLIQEKLDVNMDIDEVSSTPVGCRWFKEKLPDGASTASTDQWEYSEYIVD